MPLILSLFLALSPLNANAACPASDSSCDFYICKEQEHPCGPRGYWMEFGQPYCEKFLLDEGSFSPQSQVWLQDVRLCLQERVADISSEFSCETIHKEAMHSHVSCYVDTGFCELTYFEKLKIYWYLKGALRNSRTWLEAQLLNQACKAQNFVDFP